MERKNKRKEPNNINFVKTLFDKNGSRYLITGTLNKSPYSILKIF